MISEIRLSSGIWNEKGGRISKIETIWTFHSKWDDCRAMHVKFDWLTTMKSNVETRKQQKKVFKKFDSK